MKKAVTLAGVTVLALVSFADAHPVDSTRIQAGTLVEKIFEALQHQSADAYAELFPALDEFHRAMERSGGFYGTSLRQAQQEFANEYAEILLPELCAAFTQVLADGKSLGIDWSRITLVSWELTPAASSSYRLAMKIRHQDATYAVVINNVMVLNDQARVSHFIRIG